MYIKYANRHFNHKQAPSFMTYFYTAAELTDRVEGYFSSIRGAPKPETKTQLRSRKKESDTSKDIAIGKEGEPALLTGLALYLGFCSLDDFEAYEQKGVYKKILKEARLRVEVEYERRLHQPAPTGAIFALRCMGWSDKAREPNTVKAGKLAVIVTETGQPLATSEKDVVL